MTTAPPVGSAPAGAPGPDDAPVPAVRPPVRTKPVRTSHKLRYAVVGLVLVGSLAFLIVKGLSSALDFYLPANQAVAQRFTLGTQTFNLEGLPEPGSIHPTRNGVEFVLTSGSTKVPVVNTGSPPQLFQANIPVIAVGHFNGTSLVGLSFVSDQILVKHSSTYIAAHPGRVTAPNGSKR